MQHSSQYFFALLTRKYPTKGVHPPTSVQIPHSEKKPNGNSSAKAEMGHSIYGGGHSWDGTSYVQTSETSTYYRVQYSVHERGRLPLYRLPTQHAADEYTTRCV